MKMFNDGWLVKYGLVCAGLLLGANVSAQISDWSAQVIGGTPCDSQLDLKNVSCAKKNSTCTSDKQKCNQASGNHTQICQTDAGGDACTSTNCEDDQSNDTLNGQNSGGALCTNPNP